MFFPDFAAVEAYLNSLINYEHTFPLGGRRDWPKLEPTRNAVRRLGLSLRLPDCVHIAGTKGKGSVLTFLEALLSPDQPTLSFSSPHLVSVKERIRLDGELLPDNVWQKGFSDIVPQLSADPAIRLSYFEATFIFYLWAAHELRTQIHLVETGLGGRWDATNVLEETLAVLTPVDYDHTEVLGKTLTEIATDKSGIIKPSARVVMGRQPAEALQVYERVLDEQNADVSRFGMDFRWSPESGVTFRYEDAELRVPDVTLAVPGDHQRDNAAVAIRTARGLREILTAEQIRARLANCVVPGRQQLLPGLPDVLLDVAHNPISFRALAETLKANYHGRKILAVIGMVKDKDARGSLEALRGLVAKILLVELNSPRSAKSDQLAAVAEELQLEYEIVPSLTEAFARIHAHADHELGLVAGSFYLAGDYLIWRRNAGIA